MATKTYTLSDVSLNGDGSAMSVVWAAVTSADTFQAIKMPGFTARSISIQSTFDSATVVINGSIDGTNYTGLTSPAGVAISKTSAFVGGIFEAMLYYQPAASGGGGSQSIVVSMLFTKVSRYGGN